MQLLVQADNDPENQVFRIQITDAPDELSIVTTPSPASSPSSYTGTELTLPMCGPGAESDPTHKKMTWKVNNMYTVLKFIDTAGGVTLHQRVNMTGILWFNGTATEIAGGIGMVEVYHR